MLALELRAKVKKEGKRTVGVLRTQIFANQLERVEMNVDQVYAAIKR